MRRLRTAALLVSMFGAGTAFAQTPVARPTPLPAFGRGMAATDDSTAIVHQPANLGFMPSSELRWSSLYLSNEATLPWQGHAFGVAFPIDFLSLATGLRLDLVDPPDQLAAFSLPFRANYQWLTWALAFSADETTSIGFSWKNSFSDNPRVDGISAWSVGLSTRPADVLGLSFAMKDVGSPKSESGDALAATYDLGLALRPFQTRALELGLEASYVTESTGYWVPRATLGVDIPELGRLRGDFAISDPTEETVERQWLAAAVMSFAFNGSAGSFELGAGSTFGDALGPDAENDAHTNLAFDVAFKGHREAAAAESPPHAVRIRIEDTPGTRQHLGLLRRLWRIAEREPSVAAVVLELRTSPASSLAHVQELRDAVHHLRMNGKKVLCHLEDGDGASLYLCSAANRILVNPAGGVRFAGMRSRYIYYKGLLDKLGVRADFVRIGAHKSAPEAFMREGATDVARADKIDLLSQYERLFTIGVAAGRGIDGAELRRRIAKGPFIAEEARDAGLVDALAFDDEIEAAVGKLVGGSVALVDYKNTPRAPQYFGASPGIAVVYVDGDMVDGRSQVIPLLGTKLVGSYTIAESLKQARENPLVGAVVLRVESGGGSALCADVIWRQIELTTKVKPVVVSMGSAAASGGYYIATPATRVFANPLTVTGSIGIFYGKADVAELLRRIGVSIEVYKTAPRADAESLYRPFTPEERKELERKVGQFYDQFLTRVATGRRMTKAQVDAVAQGRVWTGEQALAKKLVDEVGGFRQALDHARKLAELPDHAPIVELPEVETTLLGRVLGIEGMQSSQALTATLPPELVQLARALAPFLIHPADKPLARVEIADIEP